VRSVARQEHRQHPVFAALAGFVGGLLVPIGEALLLKIRADDVVGAVPVHALCGVWGTIAAGAFFGGDLFNVQRVAVQTLGVGAALLWTLPLSYFVYRAIDLAMGLRVSAQDEQRGLDYAEHFEVGYSDFTTAQIPPSRDSA